MGNFYKGKPNGWGIWYDLKQRPKYVGQCMDGTKHGDGEIISDNGIKEYRGGFYMNKMHGFGILYDEIGKIEFVGNFTDGKRNGFGVDYDLHGNEKQRSQWKEGYLIKD